MEINNNNSFKNQRKKKATKRIILEVIIAIIIIVPAILLCINLRKILIKFIFKTVELKPNSKGYNTWLKSPTTITRDYYLFNITNPIEIVTDPTSATVYLKETPPYSYLLSSNKQHIQWSEDNKAISYSIYRLFNRHQTRFNPSSVNDTGIFVDLLRAMFRTQFRPKPSQKFYTLAGKSPFYQGNALEQLEGFTSDLFTTVQDKMMGPNTNKSGFVYRQNGSRLYNISIETDLMKKGQVLTFENELVPFSITSPSDYPFPVYDSLTYPSMLFDKPSFNIFNSDFCHPILIEYKESVTMFGGINMHQYKVKLIDIYSCTHPDDIKTCNEVDKLDVSKCISDSLPKNTIFLSKAHFYGSNNETIKEMNIEGFTPTDDKHDSVLYFEPYSGTLFKAAFRMQLNVEATIDPMTTSENTSELEPANKKGVKRLIPIYWIDEEINISKKVIKKFRRRLFFLRYGQYIIILSAIILTIIVIGIMEVIAGRAAKNAQYTRVTYSKAGSIVHH